jgi:membrane fusion protein
VNELGSTLFRDEALRYREDRLHGNISLATPLSWQVISFLLLAALAVSVAFLATSSYGRVETVVGVVTLDKGLAAIVPSRAGVVAALEVVEGQHVKRGQVLARIRSEEDLVGGDTASDRIRRALEDQDAQLADQGRLLRAASSAEQARLREQGKGLIAELASLDEQIDDQKQLLDAAIKDVAEVQSVAARGFISRRDIAARQATVLSRRQQLAQLEQVRASKRSDLAAAEHAMAESSTTADAQIASAQSNRAALATQRAQADLARGYVVTAPVEGVVTALSARLGQPATSARELMTIVPSHALPRIELYLPTAAAGFVRPGQDVRLAIDAFPYQQFGTVPARVATVSAATVSRQGPSGAFPVYLVTATVPHPWIKAFGRQHALAPGMTLTARIVTEKRSLLRWLFEPIFAVRNR